MLRRYRTKRGRKKKFSKQFKEHLRIGLSAAVGFTIAFAWREPLLKLANNFVLKYINSSTEINAGILSALLITFLGVIFIYFVSKILR